jgi:hypothetical protein
MRRRRVGSRPNRLVVGPNRRVAAVVALLVALVLGACGSSQVPSGPLGPCGADKADAISIGGFPELEAVLPTSLGRAAPNIVNSGRSCTDKALGSLVTHGIHELRYAGATWTQGPADATVVAVLATPSDQPLLDEAWVEEFYTAGAVAGTKTDNVTTTRPVLDPVGQVFRIDALNDLSLQTVVTWNDHGLIHVVIVASEVGPTASRADHDQRVLDAVAIATVPAPTPVPGGTAVPAPSSAP